MGDAFCGIFGAGRGFQRGGFGAGSYIRFTIADPKEGETLPYVNLSFENQNMEDGKVYISRMSDGVFSGTFEGGRITEGRFDLKYKE